MKTGVLQITWHAFDPVLSVDIHPISGILATAGAGADHDIKMWVLRQSENPKLLTRPVFEANLSYHSTAVNVIRFSRSGAELASGADGGDIAIWKPVPGKDNVLVWKVQKALRFHPKDVLDLNWSNDGTMIASGSVDNTCVVWDVTKGVPLQILSDHQHYVQGVAWDPFGKYLASLSSDRSCRIYEAKSQKMKGGREKKTFVCQHVIAKADLTPKLKTTVQSQEADRNRLKANKSPLFLDESMPSFFRRLSWSPDGSFLLAPAGAYKQANATFLSTAFALSRSNLRTPVFYLPEVNSAVVAVRFCPVLFARHRSDEATNAAEYLDIRLPYRMVFAVATLNSVLVYDTQKVNAIAILGGLHYAAITDLAWSPDGRILFVSSQDGYCSVAEFDEGELGESLDSKDIPRRIAKYFPSSTVTVTGNTGMESGSIQVEIPDTGVDARPSE